MPAKIARSSPRPSFGLPELLVATHISRPGFQGRRKIATIHAGLGVIRGMSAKASALLFDQRVQRRPPLAQ